MSLLSVHAPIQYNEIMDFDSFPTSRLDVPWKVYIIGKKIDVVRFKLRKPKRTRSLK